MSILINGSPAGYLTCSRGVRQGDPFSPLLFCVAGEVPIYWPLSSAGSLHLYRSGVCLSRPTYCMLMTFCFSARHLSLMPRRFLRSWKTMLKFQASSIILTRQVEGLLWLSTLSLESHSSYIMDLGYPNQITYLPQHLSHQRHHLLVGRFLLLLKFSITSILFHTWEFIQLDYDMPVPAWRRCFD